MPFQEGPESMQLPLTWWMLLHLLAGPQRVTRRAPPGLLVAPLYAAWHSEWVPLD